MFYLHVTKLMVSSNTLQCKNPFGPLFQPIFIDQLTRIISLWPDSRKRKREPTSEMSWAKFFIRRPGFLKTAFQTSRHHSHLCVARDGPTFRATRSFFVSRHNSLSNEKRTYAIYRVFIYITNVYDINSYLSPCTTYVCTFGSNSVNLVFRRYPKYAFILRSQLFSCI